MPSGRTRTSRAPGRRSGIVSGPAAMPLRIEGRPRKGSRASRSQPISGDETRGVAGRCRPSARDGEDSRRRSRSDRETRRRRTRPVRETRSVERSPRKAGTGAVRGRGRSPIGLGARAREARDYRAVFPTGRDRGAGGAFSRRRRGKRTIPSSTLRSFSLPKNRSHPGSLAMDSGVINEAGMEVRIGYRTRSDLTSLVSYDS
jgi:hypothetical protein